MMKTELRKEIKEKLEQLSSAEIIEKSKKIIEKIPDTKNVCVYVSKKGEVCTHCLIKNLLKKINVFVPYVEKGNMFISKIKDFSELKEGMFGILEPVNRIPYCNKVNEVNDGDKIDMIVVPGIAFDKKGNRLGKGGGYYDKFLQYKNVLKIGLAFEEQIVDNVPVEEHDIKMDLIITDKRIIDPKILNGQEVATKIKQELSEKIKGLEKKPCLAVVLVGEKPASKIYVKMKEKACQEVGIVSKKYLLSENVEEEELVKLIKELNEDTEVNGILVQLPLPKHINEQKIIEMIDFKKDVDGFHPINVGKVSIGREGFISCTPKGVMRLLKEYKVEITGKKVVIVGRSNIVGKPIALLLLNEGATVTICHSKTKNLKEETLGAEILIVAVGKPNLITAEMVKEGAIVIDVGINRIEDFTQEKGYYVCGDVDFENVKKKVSLITPVPRGVGPMTIAMLMENTIKANEINNSNQVKER